MPDVSRSATLDSIGGSIKILAIERNVLGVTDDSFTEELLEAEAHAVWELQQSGTLRELYFRADRRQAVVVLESASVSDARACLSELPLVRAGFIDFEVIPLIAYSGFARLFRRE